MIGSLRGLRRMAMEALVPKNQAGRIAWGELALDYAPDLMFAAVSGANAAPGWGPALVAEDLTLGLGASMLGRLSGEVVGRKAWKLDPAHHAERLAQLRMAGSMGLSMGPALAGYRPITKRMIEEEQRSAEARQQAMLEEQNRHLQEQALGLTLGSIGMASRGPWETLGGLQSTG